MGINLSGKLRDSGDGSILHWCPGCESLHLIQTQKPSPNGAIWRWDGDAESPTFTPSINIVGHCHYFISAGQIQFCGDSTHDLAGKTVPLPDLPEWLK